jgi:phosphoribosylglycinamide formyltransferase-1
MEAIVKACQSGVLENVLPVVVISSSSGVEGIGRAESLGVETLVINPKDFESREKFGEKIIEELEKRTVNFVGQYGWGLLTPESVVTKFEGRIVNQHPGPLDTGRLDFGGPGMYGMRVHQARLEFVRKTNRDFWTEATCHKVTNEFDKGEILKRKQVPIFLNDTAEILQKRTLPVEHEVQIEALKMISEGRESVWKRETPLIKAGEEEILQECKEIAKKMYPKG